MLGHLIYCHVIKLDDQNHELLVIFKTGQNCTIYKIEDQNYGFDNIKN